MQPDPSLSPMLFFETLNGYQRTAAIKTAVELDLFSAIGSTNKTSGEIADTIGAAERGVRILADSLTVLGFLVKSGDSYALTDASAMFLVRSSPAYVGSIAAFLTDPDLIRGFNDLTGAVRQGGTTVTGDGSVDPESPMWVTFARAMMPMMFPAAQQMAEMAALPEGKDLKVLDIAASHGIFGIAMAQRYPRTHIYALDWANVLEVATENAQKFGVGDRHHLIPGSAFDVDLGTGYDIILLTNFLHHFDKETCESVIKRCHAALNDDGKVITLEFVPNDDRISPPGEALFSLVMLAGTPAGDAYTFNELKTMFENSGFSRNEHIPLAPTPQHVIISQK